MKKPTNQGDESPNLTKSDIDFFTAGDILQDIDRIDKILASDIFHEDNCYHPLAKSAFTELVICLYDLLRKADKFALRICFTEDVFLTPAVVEVTPEIKDVTDLVRFVRDAMCHIHLFNHWIIPQLIKASFFTLYGKTTHSPFGPDYDITFTSDYTDDACFFFGVHKIYLRRHIIRAFVEAKGQLLPLPEFPNDVLVYDPLDGK